MNNKIVVSRELRERCMRANDEAQPSQLYADLHDLLMAPVVERQPVDRIGAADSLYLTMWPNDTLHECERGNPKYDACLRVIDAGYRSPTELAELQAKEPCSSSWPSLKAAYDEAQATIARLTAENERIKTIADNYSALLMDANAERERLKGGQGEPAAEVIEHYGFDDGIIRFKTSNMEQLPIGTLLYTSQPAPASVVLPDRMPGDTEDSDVLTDCRNEGWNACLDKVKELNQSPPIAEPANKEVAQ